MTALNFSPNDLQTILSQLPADLQQQVVDYAAFLVERQTAKRATQWFWQMIAEVDTNQADRERITASVVELLAAKSDAEIFLFDDLLSDHLRMLDTPALYEVAKKGMAGTSDTFLYARCAVIARGKAFFDKVQETPALFLFNDDLEPLLTIAACAYEKKHRKPYEHLPRSNYETRTNQEAWGEKAIRFVRSTTRQ